MSINRPRAFTLLELLVVIAVITLLMSFLLPGLKRAKDAAQQIHCMSNSRQLAAAVHLYLVDENGLSPMPSIRHAARIRTSREVTGPSA